MTNMNSVVVVSIIRLSVWHKVASMYQPIKYYRITGVDTNYWGDTNTTVQGY